MHFKKKYRHTFCNQNMKNLHNLNIYLIRFEKVLVENFFIFLHTRHFLLLISWLTVKIMADYSTNKIMDLYIYVCSKFIMGSLWTNSINKLSALSIQMIWHLSDTQFNSYI